MLMEYLYLKWDKEGDSSLDSFDHTNMSSLKAAVGTHLSFSLYKWKILLIIVLYIYKNKPFLCKKILIISN